MAGDAQTLYQQGVRAIQDENPSQARRLFVEALRADPENDSAWVWLSHVVDDPRKKVECVDRALAINPANKQAQVTKKRIATGEYPTITGGKRSTQPLPIVTGKRSTQPMPVTPGKKTTQSMLRAKAAESRPGDMGPVIASVGLNKWQLTQKIIYSVLCIGLSILFFVGARAQKPGDNTATYLMIAAVLPLFGVVAFAYSIIMAFGIQVFVHEDGIRKVQAGNTQSWRWEDFTAVRIAENIQTFRYYGIPVYRLHTYVCRLMIDTKVALKLDKDIQKYKEVGQIVTQKTTPIFFERNYNAHRKGETVNYGKVAVNRDGIRDGRRSITWDEIASWEVNQGWLIIQKQGRGKFRLQLLDMPNAYVLMAMIEKITGKHY